MRDLAVKLILSINRLVPPTSVHMSLVEAKRTIRGYQQWEYEEIKRIFEDFKPYWDLEGKMVLDVGCGLGGKLLFYAECGAREVIGIDLRPFSATYASRLASEYGGDGTIHIAVADGGELPFADDSFDVVISINVLEHVTDPISVLKECRRVLRPDGFLYLYFPPFYSPWGAHVDGWINFPWPHLLFSERSIVRAAALIEHRKRYNEQFILPAQVHWNEIEELYELNRLTIQQFLRLVKRADLQILQCRFLPFARHALRQAGPWRLLPALLYAASRIPFFNEIMVTKIACVMTKQRAGIDVRLCSVSADLF